MNDSVNVVFEIPYLNLPVTNVIVMSWIAMGVIILWAFLATRKMKAVPTGLQNTAEIVVETINNFTEGFMGRQKRITSHTIKQSLIRSLHSTS